MLKKNLRVFLLISVIFLIVSCATKPVIVYLEPDPPIFSAMPENAQLEDTGNITANEYKLMINIIQFKIWGHYVRKTVKLITAGDYQVYLDQYNKQIDDINKKIEELEILD